MFSLHGYGPSIFEGTILTLEVSLASLFIAMILGMGGALAKISSSIVLRGLATVYTTVIRGIPDLVLMLLVFFGAHSYPSITFSIDLFSNINV
jgi:arginine/ornithine transport system permease protein